MIRNGNILPVRALLLLNGPSDGSNHARSRPCRVAIGHPLGGFGISGGCADRNASGTAHQCPDAIPIEGDHPLSVTLPAEGARLASPERQRFTLDGWDVDCGRNRDIRRDPRRLRSPDRARTLGRHLEPSRLDRALGIRRQHAVADARCRGRDHRHRCFDRVARHDVPLPGRRILSWALLLPLAVPSYILAFVITDQLEYAGNVQSALRGVFGWTSPREYWFPEIPLARRGDGLLSLVLYPYVYLLARAALHRAELWIVRDEPHPRAWPGCKFFQGRLAASHARRSRSAWRSRSWRR